MKYALAKLVGSIIFATSVDARQQRPLRDATYPGEPRYICDECVPKELVLSPGIGFDLASSYATVAIRYQNLTTVDVGRIGGSEEYIDLMARLGPPYVYIGPPFDTIADRIRYNLDQASPISLPDLINLSTEDWAEAKQLTGLDVLTSYRNYGMRLNNVNAAWAGMGYGLCEHWRDVEKCDEEEELIEPKFVLAVSFSNEELEIHKTYVQNAHFMWDVVRESHRDLGYKSWRFNPENTTFWDSVGNSVARVVDIYPEYEIQDLILLGEYAEEKRFLDAVWKALGEKTDVQKLRQPLQVSGFSAEFVAARGAAEFAKRWQGEPLNCIEGDWCTENEGSGGSDVNQEL